MRYSVSWDHAVSLLALVLYLEVTEDEIVEALREFEADLLGAGRGIQLRRRPHSIRMRMCKVVGRSCQDSGPEPVYEGPKGVVKGYPPMPYKRVKSAAPRDAIETGTERKRCALQSRCAGHIWQIPGYLLTVV